MFRKIWTSFTLFVLSIKLCVGVEKYWLPNLEWETVENWADKRIPETDSHVIFPLDMRHAAGIGKSGDLRLSGIDLARTGSLALSKNGNLELSEPRNSVRKISEWSRSGHLFWADPQHWNGSSKAAPHLEQVPCRQDNVVLPGKNFTFSVLLPMRNIEVRSIRTADEKRSFSAWQWFDLRRGIEFDKGIFTVKYAEYSCEKCPCQNDPNGYYLEEICAIQRPNCGFTACEFPLTVEGHCCPYCGGRVALTKKASLLVVQDATNEALEGYARKLAWYVRRTWNGAIEILIKEKGDYSGLDILEATEIVKGTLLSMKIEVMAAETAGAALQDQRVAATLVPLFVTPFAILIILFVVFLYFGYTYRHIVLGCSEIFSSIRDGVLVDKAQASKPFSFARFENISEGNVQIANATDTGERKPKNEETGGEDSASGGRFENPLYRSKRRLNEEGEVLNMEAPVSLTVLKAKVEDHNEEVEVDIDQ